MREIRFRAWHEFGNMETRPCTPGMIYDDKPGDCLKWKIEGQKITDIMQYTNLRDRNNVRIWEGDLITYGGTTYEVRWNFCRWIMFDAEFDKHDAFGMPMVGPSFSRNKMADIKVIGNIHENPELLEGI